MIAAQARVAPATRHYRFGRTTLALSGDVAEVFDGIHTYYGDCAVDGVAHADIGCDVEYLGGSRISLNFSATASPALIDIATALLRPRRELDHLVALPDEDGWARIGDLNDSNRTLIRVLGNVAVIDLTVAPEEFAVNLIVGAAQRAGGLIYLHAGGLSLGGRGVLICGRSGGGKSTMTGALAARGHRLLGDETIGCDAGQAMLFPFRRTMKFRPGPKDSAVRQKLAAAPRTVLIDANGVGCTWARGSALFGRDASDAPAPLHSVFFLRAFRDQPRAEPFAPSVDDLPELHCLTQSLSAVVSWPRAAAPRLIRYARLIEMFARVRCYHLDLGGPEDSAEMIERMVLAG